MKLSILTTVLCVSAAVQALKGDDCLDATSRYNLEDVCRNECAQEADAVAFSVNYKENNDDTSCRCYKGSTEGIGIIYKASGDRESQWTCYSMERAKTEIVDYGDCIIDSSSFGTKHLMQKCEDDEGDTDNCLDNMRYNLENLCHNECLKHDSAAFAVSYDDNDDICRCYPKREDGREYTGSGDIDTESLLACYSMGAGAIPEGWMTPEVWNYGDCVTSDIYLPRMVKERTMKWCPQVEKLLRGSRVSPE